jgi:hypothetical protein
MQRISFLVFLFFIAGYANAEMFITVDGYMDPDPVSVDVGDTLQIGIAHSLHANQAEGEYYLGIGLGGEASWDISGAMFPFPFTFEDVTLMDDVDIANLLGVESPFVYVSVLSPLPVPLQEKRIIDGIWLQCDGLGDVSLKLFDDELTFLDTQAIQQVPEPATLLLLGLGGLALLRKRGRQEHKSISALED